MTGRFLRLILIMMLTAAGAEVSARSFNDKFTADNKVYDFGVIQEADGKVSHTFVLTNHTDHPITIMQAICGCSCTKSDFSTKPVPPGAQGKITITFDPYYRPGKFSKEINVLLSDDTYMRLWIKGDVIEMKHPVSDRYRYDYGDGLWMNFETVNFGRLAPGQKKIMAVKFINNSRRVMRLTFLPEEDLPGLVIPYSIILQPGEESQIPFRMTGSDALTQDRKIKVWPTIGGIRTQKPLLINVRPQKITK